MKKIFYTLLIACLASLSGHAQTLSVQGSVNAGTMGGLANHLVALQIHLSPAQVVQDTVITDSLGFFSTLIPLPPGQGPGYVIATTQCNNLMITLSDSFFAPTWTTNHLFNCGTIPNPGSNIWFNGTVTPTALGDTIEMTLYRASALGMVVDTSITFTDTMNMGFMFYGFRRQNPGAYTVAAEVRGGTSNFVKTYYGNTTLQNQATVVNAFNAGSYNGLNIQMQSSPTQPIINISGTVTGYTPSTTSFDTMQVILIEVQNNIWTPIDTVVTLDSAGLGGFFFSTTSTGPFAVLATLLSGNAANYVPTYNGNTTTWTNTTPIQATPNATIFVNISLQAASGTGNGGGSAGGGIFNGLPVTGNGGMVGLPVQLQDAAGSILKVMHTDQAGSYHFGDLPFGTYAVRVELFGVASTLFAFTLSATQPDVEVNFTMGANGLAASFEAPELLVQAIYPNPATDWVKLQLVSQTGIKQLIKLRDIQGRLLYTESVELERGMQEITLSLAGYDKGIYLLEIEGSNRVVKRIVIQ